MRKTTLVLCTLLGVAACAPYETDLAKGQMERDQRRALARQEMGCQLTDDHLAYRDCLIKTYKNQKPKTYTTTIDENGKSVAVVKNETKQSYDEESGTYKTERVIVIETEEKLVPVPVLTEETVVTEVPTETTVTTTTSANETKTTTQTVKTEVESVAVAAPVVEPAVKDAEPVAEEPVAQAPAERETWWGEYQKNKEPVKAEPQCPCADPNEPCPQCVDK